MIILDTNIISEIMKNEPNLGVLSWLSKQSPVSIYTTTITQAEILYGLEILPSSKRKAGLSLAINSVFEIDLQGRIISYDSSAARTFAKLVSNRKRLGRPISHTDAQIAAITLSRGAKLATRNTKDFKDSQLELINPFD